MDVYLASQAAGRLAARTLEWEGEGTEGDEQLYLHIGRGERAGGLRLLPAETNDSRVESHISGMAGTAGRAGLDMASQLPYNLAQFTL
jgi:hypothetical protein